MFFALTGRPSEAPTGADVNGDDAPSMPTIDIDTSELEEALR